jgi:hypothetical protein
MADLDDSAIPSEDEDERDKSQRDQSQPAPAPGEGGEGGPEAGETLHLLREDAYDHFTISTWQSNVPVLDEVAKLVHDSLGGSRNAAKIRNKVSCITSSLFTLHNV